jgi:predicted metal-dependent hydrolase
MVNAAVDYDPRYLAGILLFNDHEFFAAHEVWEDLWGEEAGPSRRFTQGLIQAAVALLHFGNGNLRGAVKLFRTGRDYMAQAGSPFRGLDSAAFWRQMEQCFAEALVAAPDAEPRPRLDEAQVPRIELDPPPAQWPDPKEFVEEDEEDDGS